MHSSHICTKENVSKLKSLFKNKDKAKEVLKEKAKEAAQEKLKELSEQPIENQ